MNIVDLTLPVHEGMLTFPSENHPKVGITILGRIEKTGRETRKMILGTHTGTHIDAPAHFIRNGMTIDRIDLGVLVGQAHMIDLSAVAPKTAISKIDLLELGNCPGVERLLIRTDWDAHWNTDSYYSDYPYLSHEACAYLVGRGIKMLALDVPSPDNPSDSYGSGNDSPNHKYLFQNGVVVAEYLANLNKISRPDFLIAALPLRLRGGDAAPARIVAYWE